MILHRVLLPLVGLSLLVFSAAAAEPAAVEAPTAADWRPLFNGKDLAGWDGDEKLWSVRDGVIHGETTSEQKAKGNTFLIAKDLKLKDF